jgi:hypothetical protein
MTQKLKKVIMMAVLLVAGLIVGDIEAAKPWYLKKDIDDKLAFERSRRGVLLLEESPQHCRRVRAVVAPDWCGRSCTERGWPLEFVPDRPELMLQGQPYWVSREGPEVICWHPVQTGIDENRGNRPSTLPMR